MTAVLSTAGNRVTGEVVLHLAPGTLAHDVERALLVALVGPLNDAAAALGAVLAAAPSRFARPLPGKDAGGGTRYAVRGRAEGDRLVPDHTPTPAKKARGGR